MRYMYEVITKYSQMYAQSTRDKKNDRWVDLSLSAGYGSLFVQPCQNS